MQITYTYKLIKQTFPSFTQKNFQTQSVQYFFPILTIISNSLNIFLGSDIPYTLYLYMYLFDKAYRYMIILPSLWVFLSNFLNICWNSAISQQDNTITNIHIPPSLSRPQKYHFVWHALWSSPIYIN